MNKASRESIFNQAKQWVLESREMTTIDINEKLTVDTTSSPNSLVKKVNKNTEPYLADNINKTYPLHFILSEEGFGDELLSLDGTVWIIDPIDRTMNS